MIPQTNDIIELSIYADYLEDQGRYIESLHLREELQELLSDTEWCWDYPCNNVGGLGGAGIFGYLYLGDRIGDFVDMGEVINSNGFYVVGSPGVNQVGK